MMKGHSRRAHHTPRSGLLPALALAFLAALLPGPVAAQSDEEKARTELQALQGRIKQINRELASARERRGGLQAQLRQAELDLARLQRELTRNRKAIATSDAELASLNARREDLRSARGEQQAQVIKELRAAWQMGNEARLKVLLSQQNPQTVARTLAYHRYFFAARNEMLERYRDILIQLDRLETDIERTSEQLEAEREALRRRELSLAEAQAARTQALAKLSTEIQQKGGQLKQLEQDRAKLEELLAAIQEAVVNLQVPDNFQAFAEARGKMPWPVAGKAANRFGQPRNEGKMRWQGVQIPARAGTSVSAIHHGRVVYADWLRGMGLLLIIDHGDGYMSLYAHNQSLLRDVGEWVTAGTPVSTVGSSGGLEQPALYFEVRHRGKPVDPARWSRK